MYVFTCSALFSEKRHTHTFCSRIHDFTLSSNRGYTIVGSFKLYLAEIPQTVAEKVTVAGYINTD